jgi:hypothetical protein
MHFANFMIDAGIEKDTLGSCCLTGIDVRRNANIPVSLNRCLAGHVYLPYLSQTARPLSAGEQQGGGNNIE